LNETTWRAPLAQELAVAAAACAAVSSGVSLPQALARALAQHPVPAASRAPVRDMAYASVRRLGTTRALLAQLAPRPIAGPLAALLQTALVQLFEPQRACAVIVDQAVRAAQVGAASAGHAKRSGAFVNAVLRRFLREREALLGALAQAQRAGAPDPDWPPWWVDCVRQDHPQAWHAVLAASSAAGPLSLRLNTQRVDAAAYLDELAAAGIAARQVGPQAICLEDARPVEEIPGFRSGLVSVQDAGAQLAAPLLGLAPGQRVLDACAAPGGKTLHLLESAPIDLLALDVDAQRLQRVQENLARAEPALGGAGAPTAPRVQLMAADAAQPEQWWDGRAFDRILLDAPCSASGIVRRHPDIRWLRRRGDLATLAAQQRRLLDALWPLLAPSGRLLYVTCSLFAVENEAVIQQFLGATPNARRQALLWSFAGESPQAIAQLLPIADRQRDHDGFFYALLVKLPD